jgi:hypothetical protein
LTQPFEPPEIFVQLKIPDLFNSIEELDGILLYKFRIRKIWTTVGTTISIRIVQKTSLTCWPLTQMVLPFTDARIATTLEP